MRGLLIAALAAVLAAFVFAAPRPASALPAAAALNYSHANSDLVEVKRWYRRGWRRPYYRPYGYYRRPYYRPYRYYRPYYGYYRPYYWRRPGVSIWLGW